MADTTLTPIDTADVMAVDAAVARSTGSDAFGITVGGFVPKSFARLLAEKMALARGLLGDDLDLTSGSVIRKLLEVSALEDARTWAALAAMYDNGYVTSATGEALSRLGDEHGLPRPFLEATGRVHLKMAGDLPPSMPKLVIPRGARMLTTGGHHLATDEQVVLTAGDRERDVAAIAFFPGPSHNVDPKVPTQKVDDWNRNDEKLAALVDAEGQVNSTLSVLIEHTAPFTGGERRWSDERYRRLLLRAPRSLWSVDAILVAASLVPGVREARVHDAWGGLDIRQSIFGNFNFIERVFNSERDLASPYYFTLVVARNPAAIWDGPDGLRAAVQSAIEDLRPIGIFPEVQEAVEIAVGVRARIVTKDYPLARGSGQTVDASPAAVELKKRLHARLQGYIGRITLEESVVRAAEVTQVLMNDPAVADVQDLRLVRFPPRRQSVDFAAAVAKTSEEIGGGANVELQGDQIPVYVEDDALLEVS